MAVELDAIEYGKIDNINSKEIKITPAKCFVFRRYLDYLMKNSKSEKITDFNPGRYHIYSFPTVPGITNERKWKWEPDSEKDIYNLKQYMTADIGCLKTVTILTVDSKRLIPSNISYEQFFNIPVSGWLFSNKAKYESYIQDDYNFKTYNYTPVDQRLKRKDYNTEVLAKNGFDFKYWGQNYDFADSYSYEDYLMFGIEETRLKDDCSKMTSAPADYDIKRLTAKTAAIVIAYHHDKGIIPVTYYELHNSFFTSDGIVRIEWSQNGIITVT